jgi:hypothetical protein
MHSTMRYWSDFQPFSTLLERVCLRDVLVTDFSMVREALKCTIVWIAAVRITITCLISKDLDASVVVAVLI